jgi:hypothetical protein
MEAIGSPGTGQAEDGNDTSTTNKEQVPGRSPAGITSGEGQLAADNTYRYDEYDDYIPWEI